MKFKSLADLKMAKHIIEEETKARAQKAAQEHEAKRKRLADQQIFAAQMKQTLGDVRPLRYESKAMLAPPPPAPTAQQRQKDEKMAVQEMLSDAWDASSLLDTDEALSFRRPGIGLDVMRKLRRGEWAVQAQLDLHHLRSEQARTSLAQFIRASHAQGLRCLRVVHGKGLGSPGKEPVLKPKVLSWLIQKNQVIAFVQATPAQGGAGALLVLLQTVRKPVHLKLD